MTDAGTTADFWTERLHAGLSQQGSSMDGDDFLACVQNGADLTMRLSCRRTPLIYAALRKDDGVRLIDAMADRGVNLDALDESGCTALILAAIQNREDNAVRLVLRGADIHITDKAGASPLMWAATHHLYTLARVLLERGADPDAKNGTGTSAQVIADNKPTTNMADLLLDRERLMRVFSEKVAREKAEAEGALQRAVQVPSGTAIKSRLTLKRTGT